MPSAPARILSVNVGALRAIPGAKSHKPTGIYKEPVNGSVWIDQDGLQGDHTGSVKYHGGPDQAALIYSAQDYAWWESELGRELPPGTFGENLTVTSLGEQPARVGDLWRMGEVTLQLTAPRIPCSTLAARLGEPKFVRMFARANRGGAYARVISAGRLTAGMEVSITPGDPAHPTIDELFAEWHKRKKDLALLRRALASPLASRARQSVEQWVRKQTSFSDR